MNNPTVFSTRSEEIDQQVLVARQQAVVNPKEALAVANNLREQAQSINYLAGVAGSWWVAGNAYLQLAQYTQALQANRTALELYEQVGDIVHQSWLLNGIATVYYYLAIYDTALEYYLKALALSQSINEKLGMGIQLGSIGELHLALEHYEEAQEYLQQALVPLEQALKEPFEPVAESAVVQARLHGAVASTYGAIGEIYVRKNQPEIGLTYLERAEAIAIEASAFYYLCQVQCRLGRAYRHLGQNDKALHYLTQALQTVEATNKPLMPETLLLLGYIYMDNAEYSTAVQHYQQALKLAIELEARQWVYKAHLALSLVYEKVGDLAQALQHLHSFSDIKEEVSGAKTQQALAAAQTSFEVAHAAQEREIYRLRNVELAAANTQIAELNKQLKSENLRMSSELEITQRLQQMILPREEELDQLQGLEIAPFVLAAEDVGGDYYDVLLEPISATQLKIGIGDVTGHGLESGVVMLMAQTAIRTLLNAQVTDPVQFLSILNKTLYDNINRIGSNKNLTLALLDYNQGKLRLSGQHEEVLVVRAVDGSLTMIDTMDLGFPIGLTEDIQEFVAHIELELEQGDVVVVYTDGITEAENSANLQYGLERLGRVVQEHYKESAHTIKRAVIDDLMSYIEKQTIFDDITLLVLKQL
jgi:serine phosphatase RsbU (regulator of sigma subunit)